MTKTVIITGTSRGLGDSLAEYFLKKAWKVYCVVRTEKDADKMKNINRDFCFPIVSDIAFDTIQSDIESIFSESERVDVLINNAGVGGSGALISNNSVANTETLLNVHCLGPMRVTKAVLPFLNKDGIIINISSRFGSIKKVASGELDNISCSYSYRIAKAAEKLYSLLDIIENGKFYSLFETEINW